MIASSKDVFCVNPLEIDGIPASLSEERAVSLAETNDSYDAMMTEVIFFLQSFVVTDTLVSNMIVLFVHDPPRKGKVCQIVISMHITQQ